MWRGVRLSGAIIRDGDRNDAILTYGLVAMCCTKILEKIAPYTCDAHGQDRAWTN